MCSVTLSRHRAGVTLRHGGGRWCHPVGAHVFLQVAALGEALGALRADEGPDPVVAARMSPHAPGTRTAAPPCASARAPPGGCG